MQGNGIGNLLVVVFVDLLLSPEVSHYCRETGLSNALAYPAGQLLEMLPYVATPKLRLAAVMGDHNAKLPPLGLIPHGVEDFLGIDAGVAGLVLRAAQSSQHRVEYSLSLGLAGSRARRRW